MDRRRLRGACALAFLACAGCGLERTAPVPKDDFSEERGQMVRQVAAYGVRDEAVLRALGKVRRHRFIPEPLRERTAAYGDHPCSIGHGQTISQPFIVAYMTEKMGVRKGEKVLEIGTGSGYQAAILAELGADVYSIEIVPELADHARKALAAEGYGRVRVLTGDGYRGWPEHAPFQVVIVTCAPGDVPVALTDQLAEGGRMILPLGDTVQRLVILRKAEGRLQTREDLPVRFVPMVRGPPQ